MSIDAMRWLEKVVDKGALKTALNEGINQARAKPIHTHMAVMWNLAWRYSDKHGYAFPYVATISTDTGLSRASVQRALRDLEAFGWIERTLRTDARSHYGLPRFERWVADGMPMPEDGSQRPHGETAPPHGETTPPHGERKGPHGEAHNNKNTTERDRTPPVKPPSGGTNVRSINPGPSTQAQVAYLADLTIITTGYPVTQGERLNWRAWTKADADAEIKQLDSELRARRPDDLHVAPALLKNLSDAGRTFYEHLISREYAA